MKNLSLNAPVHTFTFLCKVGRGNAHRIFVFLP